VTGTSGTASSSRKAEYGDGTEAQRRQASGQARVASEQTRPGSGHVHPGFEQARDELTELVKRLEAGGLTLEQSLQLWERGEHLAAICEQWLEGARARMAAALTRPEGSGETPDAPF
jgi:exodeoxyribonuclease VII small subunit